MNLSSTTGEPWVVFDYEVEQFHAMCKLLETGNEEYAALSLHLQNAVVESVLLHTRILVDILRSNGTYADDIKLSALLPSFTSEILTQLKTLYGKSGTENSPCWTINKYLAHPTSHRGSEYDYTDLLSQLAPLILLIVQEVNYQRKQFHSNQTKTAEISSTARWLCCTLTPTPKSL